MLTLQSDVSVPDNPPYGHPLGIDVGLDKFLATEKCLGVAQTFFKRGVYFGKVDYRYTSQICPNCGTHTGKKDLSERAHKCAECGYECNQSAAAKVICQRGVTEVGQIVIDGKC